VLLGTEVKFRAGDVTFAARVKDCGIEREKVEAEKERRRRMLCIL